MRALILLAFTIPAWAQFGTASAVQQINGVPNASQCVSANNVGQVRARKDGAAPDSTFYICSNTAPGVYEWVLGAGGGSGTGADPYDAAVTAQTTLTVTAVTHEQGTKPNPTCVDGGSSPYTGANCSWTVATNGDVVYTWSPAFTGRVRIFGGGTGEQGIQGPVGPAGPAGGVDSVTAGPGIIASPTTGDVVVSAVGSPGYVPNGLVSGGGVEWVTGLDFTVGAASYVIGGTSLTSALTNVTLAAADPTDPRIDIIVLTSSGTAAVVAGVAAPSPVAPVVDPDTQIALAFINVAAAGTVPTGITYTTIYKENIEWTSSAVGGTCALASASNPYEGAVDVECTSAIAGNYVQFVAPSPIDLGTFNSLTFYVRSKAAWANAKSLQLAWYNSTTQRGVIIPIRTGQFGFNSSTTGSYQQIQIPIGLFGLQGIPVDRIRLTVVGGGGAIGMYMDAFTLQSGASPPPDPTAIPAMIWKGTWSAATGYAVNDVVSSGGATYVAIAASTNTVPPSGNYWSRVGLTTAVRSFGGTFVSSDGVTALTAGATSYFTVPYACTIAAWSISVNAGTATVDIWKVATGTAIPTGANTITASATPAIAANTHVRSTTLTGWGTSVAANDVIGINLEVVATATYVNLTVECNQ